jgi:AraC-like DNA-binding protein
VVPAGRNEGISQIRDAVAEALASSVAGRVLASLSRRLPRLALDCIKWAIEHCHHHPTVEDLAEPFAVSPRALTRMLRRSGAPSPGRILLWGRLLRAIHLLSERNATVERVAFTVGYSSGAALTRALRRETGYATAEVLRRGGIGCVLDGFARRELRPSIPPGSVRWRPSSPVAARRRDGR